MKPIRKNILVALGLIGMIGLMLLLYPPTKDR